MIIKNCKVIFEDRIEEAAIQINDGKIVKINPVDVEDECILDGDGLYISPGFIDVHIHGAGGHDTMEGNFEALNVIAKTIANKGTTSFLPTTMTCAVEDIKKAISAAAEAKRKGTEGAEILGVHLEGPFINPSMIGAQNPDFLQEPSIELYESIVMENSDVVTSITLAPEVKGAEALIKYLKDKGVTVSIGHSKANYEETVEGIKWGISHSTHLYNAMTGLHHREPGVVGAIFDTDITTETICDGIHIAYPSLRTAFKVKSIEKVLLVTDAMMACCMEDGTYSLGGQEVNVGEGAARLKNGALAGSVLTLDKAIRNVYENTSYELYDIVKMATYNAAKHCNVHNRKGVIKEGYDADIVLFDEKINIKKVIIAGKIYK